VAIRREVKAQRIPSLRPYGGWESIVQNFGNPFREEYPRRWLEGSSSTIESGLTMKAFDERVERERGGGS